MQLKSFPEQLIPHIDTKLPFGYTENTKKQVEEILKNGINDQAPKRTVVEGITIDGVESLDLDDGIWAETRKDGGYTIFISIADPTEYIDILSPIDLDAMNKATSIYLKDDTIFMLPRELATDLVSLNHNTTRLSQTVQIDYDDQMNVVNSNFYESKFYNKYRFDYSSFRDQYFSEGYEFHSQLRLLDKLAQKLRKKRLAKGILTEFDDAERGMGNKFPSGKNIASRLIEELMVSANIQTSIFQQKNYPEYSIHRNHMPELEGSDFCPTELERAFYSNKMMFHFGLKEHCYTHFTSPMRRYFDFVLHRQLKSHLRGDEFNYNQEDLKLIVNRYLNQQLNKVYFLEKSYHFENRVKSKYKKVKTKTNNNLKLKDIKENLQYGVKQGLKLPKEVRHEIIDIINGDTIKGDWMRIIGTYILSNESEIIEALKHRLLYSGDGKGKYRNVLNAIATTKLTKRKNDSIFTIREKNKKIYIFINNRLVVRGCLTAKDALLELFDYSLEKLKNR